MRHIWFCVVMAACSSSESGLHAGQDGGGGDGGGGGDANPPTETKTGSLTIQSTRYTVAMTNVEQGYATGTFYRIPPVTGTGSGGCTSATYGACDVQTCVFDGTASDGGLSIIYTDAGPLTISGVQVNDGTMMLTPGAYGYNTVSGAVALFNGGDSVRFVASGNSQGAPAFDVALIAPSSVQVISPPFEQGKVVASASHDLAVAWTGSSATNVTAQLAAGTSGASVIARCTFSGNSGHGIVPAAAIAEVQSAGGSSSLMVTTESRATRNPDGWDITFSLQSYGILASGIAVGTLEIQ